jgi:hypothetical protein
MIRVKLQGGIGNQMFQYALAKSLAIKNMTEVSLDLTTLNHRLPGRNYVFRTYDLGFLNIKENLTWLSKLSLIFNNFSFLLAKFFYAIKKEVLPLSIVEEKENYFFDQVALLATDGVYLDGYWQSYRYFEPISDVIKKEFTFKNELADSALEMSKSIANVNSVCINVRRADYVNNQSNLNFFGALSEDYFRQAIGIIDEKVTAPHYFIFSDDLAWAEEKFSFLERMTIIGSEFDDNRYIDKFHLITLCKHFIIPNSTFAWWGAWLSSNPDKIVIAPKQWVRDEKLNANTKDLILENWLRI